MQTIESAACDTTASEAGATTAAAALEDCRLQV